MPVQTKKLLKQLPACHGTAGAPCSPRAVGLFLPCCHPPLVEDGESDWKELSKYKEYNPPQQLVFLLPHNGQ